MEFSFSRVGFTDEVRRYLQNRLRSRAHESQDAVGTIIEDVRARGDDALLDGARRFDCPDLESIEVSEFEWHSARSDEGTLKTSFALKLAADRVLHFHRKQRERLEIAYPGGSWRLDDCNIGQRLLTIQSVGVYVPGGNAAYPSSVIMNDGPALAARVPDIVITTPARRDGTLHPSVLHAAEILGLTRVYKVGGAYAIAALALGTETISPTDKIVGPGNRFVNEAKRQLWGSVGLDGYAGSSEVCVLVDGQSNAGYAAADLLSQVEHAEDTFGLLVSLSEQKVAEVAAELERQMTGAPRESTLRAALRDHGMSFVVSDLEEAAELINLAAPEHLTLAIQEPEEALSLIRNAGCVLLGEYTPESAGDFVLGPSHTLPTAGAARFGSPVNIFDFIKVQSVSHLSAEEHAGLAPAIEAFGAMEGFPTHGYGASVRLGKPLPWGQSPQ